MAVTCLLGGPAAIAFFSGGYFTQPRLWAAVMACVLVVVAAVFAPHPLPREAPARAALAGLALLCAWSAISLLWAPLDGPALEDVERTFLYLAVLIAATALLRGRREARALEPALALGALAVIGYGLSERLVPGVIELNRSQSSFGRLEQPLTYWNAMGALGALGMTLSVRVAGDPTRRPALRAAAVPAAAALGTAVYVSFSRGALAALAAGLVALLVLSPTRAQVRAVALCMGCAVVSALVAGALPGVRSLEGGAGARELDGALMLAALLVVGAAGAYGSRLIARRERDGRLSAARLRLPRRRPALAAVAVLLVAGALGAAASAERRPLSGPGVTGATPARLSSLESNRYAYWEVALRTFVRHPLAGRGAGGFRVDWLREREISEAADDAHSLYIETAAELGLVGLGALLLFLGGVAAGARRLHRAAPVGGTGPIAVLCAWAVAVALDWHWEMPGVTLVAVVCAGAVVGRGEQLHAAARLAATLAAAQLQPGRGTAAGADSASASPRAASAGGGSSRLSRRSGRSTA